jgi:hypothetical protein
MVVVGKLNRKPCTFRPTVDFRDSIHVRAEMRLAAGGRNARMGVAFDRKSDGRLVLFTITPQLGTYAVFQKTATGWITLVPSTWTPAVKIEDWNVLDAEIRGRTVELTINRMPVSTVRLAELAEGRVELWNDGATADGRHTTVEFRELTVERIE